MKRSAIVVLVLVAGVTAMIWSGVMAYRIRKSMHTQPVSQTTLAQDSVSHQPATGSGRVDDSPTAQGLSDLRGKPAPEFTLKTPDGKTVSLADYKGKAVLLNFWATWCGPCKLEMPWLIELQKKYAAQGFTVLGVSEDDGPAKQVADFASKMGIDYPIVISDDKLNKAYGGVDYLPTSYYIGRDGKIAIETGGIISQSAIEENIKKIIATKGV
ncbi:MAG TPA: TlpA disulfide reductase family protein [Acidobacteriaceae bacterium]|nr:TlpA disulfide reductase family protein [Acidobacteriaceae bacterium]